MDTMRGHSGVSGILWTSVTPLILALREAEAKAARDTSSLHARSTAPALSSALISPRSE
jgi:hypothetical protein